MKFIDILSRAGRNLRQAKIRTALTSFAIAIGAFAITVSAMVGEGARQYISRILDSNINPATVFISAKEESETNSYGMSEIREYNENDTYESYGRYSQKMLDENDLKKLSQRDDIEQVKPYYMLTAKHVEFSNVSDKKFVLSVEAQDSSKVIKSIKGKSFGVGENIAKDEAVLPDVFLASIGRKASEMVGQTVKITVERTPNYTQDEISRAAMAGDLKSVENMTKAEVLEKEVKIVGVSKKTPEQQLASSALVVSSDLAKELNDFTTKDTPMYQKYYSIAALTKDVNKIDEVKRSISDEGYSVMTAKDAQSMIMTFVNILQAIVTGFGLLALAVSVFGIVNTMYISVLERTQQIGLMKALGASRRDIGRLFRLEAAWVGFLGAAVGVALALIAGLVANPLISETLGIGDNKMLVAVPLQVLLIIAVIVLISILSGWLPSRKAAKLDPIEALRTE